MASKYDPQIYMGKHSDIGEGAFVTTLHERLMLFSIVRIARDRGLRAFLLSELPVWRDLGPFLLLAFSIVRIASLAGRSEHWPFSIVND